MATYKHGVTSVTGSSGTRYGLRQSFSENEQVETAEARDASGNVAAITNYNKTAEFSSEVVIDTAATLPVAGSTIAISGATNNGNANVTGVNRTESGTDYQKATITAKRYITVGVPA